MKDVQNIYSWLQVFEILICYKMLSIEVETN